MNDINTNLLSAITDSSAAKEHERFMAYLSSELSLDRLEREAESERERLQLNASVRRHRPLDMEDHDFLYRLIALRVTENDVTSRFVLGPDGSVDRSQRPLRIAYKHRPPAQAARSTVTSTEAVTAAEGKEISSDISADQPVIATEPVDEDALQEFSCCICLNFMYEPATLPCGHSGCLSCFKCALKATRKCPLCKATTPAALEVNIVLRSALLRIFPHHGRVKTCVTVNRKLIAQPVCQHFGVQLIADSSDEAESYFLLASVDGVEIDRFGIHSERLALQILRDSRLSHPVNYAMTGVRRKTLLNELCTNEVNRVDYFKNLPPSVMEVVVRPLLQIATEKRLIEQARCEAFQIMVQELNQNSGFELPTNTQNFESFLPLRQMRRLFGRAGVLFATQSALEEMRSIAINDFITPLLCAAKADCLAVSTTDENVVPAIKASHVLAAIPLAFPRWANSKLRVYGYGTVGDVRHILSPAIIAVLGQVHPKLKIDEVAMSCVHDMIVVVLVDLIVAANRQAHILCGRDTSVRFVKRCVGFLMDGDWQCDVYETRKVSNCDQSGELENNESSKLPVILLEDVEFCANQILVGELAKHGVSEARKFLSRYEQARKKKGTTFESVMSTDSKLVVSPQVVRLILHLHPATAHVLISDDALVYLSAVIEYLLAEILELSGNHCSDNVPRINARCVMWAAKTDAELDAQFPGVFRDAGCFSRRNEACLDENDVSRFKSWMNEFCSALTEDEDVINPLTGQFTFKEYEDEADMKRDDKQDDERDGENDHEDESRGKKDKTNENEFLNASPLINAVALVSEDDCTEGEAQRQLLSLKALSQKQFATLQELWRSPSVVWHHRSREIQGEDCSALPIFESESIYRLCMHCISLRNNESQRSLTMTAEACDLVRKLLENYLMEFVQDVDRLVRHGKRKLVEVDDVQLLKIMQI